MTRILLTGVDGYIGIRMADYLLRRGYEIVGLDSGYHRVGWLYNAADLRPPIITKDTRLLTSADLLYTLRKCPTIRSVS
jgi:nucleoside-diphosphate-sugar epimerase